MEKVQVFKTFKLNNAVSQRWCEESVEKALAMSYPKIRCRHCNGEIRLHQKHEETSPRPHAEHLSRKDSEGCKGGHYFNGVHTMSSNPVD